MKRICGLLDALCDTSPQIILLLRGCRALGLRMGDVSEFLRVLLCTVVAILVKYLVPAERPRSPLSCEDSMGEVPGWVWEARPSPLDCVLYLDAPLKVRTKISREVIRSPSISDLKKRHGPSSGFPSSHSFFFGFLICSALRRGERSSPREVAHLAMCLAVPMSRVYYGRHYLYQVAGGLALGALFHQVLHKAEAGWGAQG